MEYTKKERDIIHSAWMLFLNGIAGSQDHKAERMLRDALKFERKERSSIHAAKALLIESAVELRKADAQTLYGISPGCRDAALVAAEMERVKHPLWAEFLERAVPAIQVKNEAQRRYLARTNRQLARMAEEG